MKKMLTEEALRMQRLAGILKENDDYTDDEWDNMESPFPPLEDLVKKNVISGFEKAGIKTGPSDVVSISGLKDDLVPTDMGEVPAAKFMQDVIEGYSNIPKWYQPQLSQEQKKERWESSIIDDINDKFTFDNGLVSTEDLELDRDDLSVITDGYSEEDHKATLFLINDEGQHPINVFQK